MRPNRVLLYFGCILLLAGCGAQSIKPSSQHLLESDAGAGQGKNVPPTVKNNILPPPKPASKVEVYSVVVTNVPAQEVLFALARDAKINLDIYPGLLGYVTLNAVNQTLPQILERISRQIDMRYEWNGPNLSVMPDTPFLKQYRIDYINMTRDADGGISNTTQVGSGTPGAPGTTTGGGSGAGGTNSSQLTIKNISKNHFWDTLVQNIKDILRETDKEIVVSRRASDEQTSASSKANTPSAPSTPAAPNPSPVQPATADKAFKDYQTLLAASVISNPEAGIITVRATAKQHEKIRQFIDQTMSSVRRQVLIEVTIAEVTLSSEYQQGIDWSRLRLGTKGFQLTQQATGQTGFPPGLQASNSAKVFLMNYANPTSKFGNLNANVALLSSFGNVKVLSSPTLSVMNNQTAILRVVDNLVYFTIDANTTQTQTSSQTTYTSTPHSVPVGLTMSLTPQISDTDSVQINVRPSITRQLSSVNDPNPSLANPCGAGVSGCLLPAITSSIPQIQTREMESVLKIENNQIAVLGGLMQDETHKNDDGVPLLSSIPLIGEFFKYRNDTTKKTELVIFIRPTVIHSASVNDDYSKFRSSLPDANFFDPGKDQATAPTMQ